MTKLKGKKKTACGRFRRHRERKRREEHERYRKELIMYMEFWRTEKKEIKLRERPTRNLSPRLFCLLCVIEKL